MFKKTKIAAVSAVVLGLSSMTAQAVSVNDAGEQGQVLIFPYYNVNNGFVSSFNVINTTGAFKAVKVRFREAKLSTDALDFNLYLSPYDVFTMQLTEKDGAAHLTTTDKSCTQPAIPGDGQSFRTIYPNVSAADMREGYLEVIEMGEIDEEAYIVDEVTGLRQKIASGGIEHDPATGTPIDCSVIFKAWDQGAFLEGGAESNTRRAIDMINPDAPTAFRAQQFESDYGYYGKAHAKGLTTPKGGLVGTSIFVDTVNITGFVAEPTSLVNYSTRAQHYLASDANFYMLPSFASGSIKTSEMLSVDSDGNAFLATNKYSAVKRDWGLDDDEVNAITGVGTVPSGINPMPIADAMLVDQLSNEYFLGDGTKTDWLIALPMKKHGIYRNYKYFDGPGGYRQNIDIPVGGLTGQSGAPFGYWQNLGIDHDVNGRISYFDREEQFPRRAPTGDDFSPPILNPDLDPGDVPFVREVNILTFNTGDAVSSAIGSDFARNFSVADGFVDGWGTLTFDNPDYDLAGERYENWVTLEQQDMGATGVPLHGFMAVNFELGRAFVGETFMHFNSKGRTIIE